MSGTQPEVEGNLKRAFFARELASSDVHHIADWVVDSSDNKDLPFLIVDKPNARVFVFDAGGRIRGAAPALLGLARGDRRTGQRRPRLQDHGLPPRQETRL